MKINLYNHYHIGDLLLNEPVIRNLCINNPTHEFTMMCHYNIYMYKDIPNLKVIYVNPNLEDRTFYTISQDENKEKILNINLWIIPIFEFMCNTLPEEKVKYIKEDNSNLECNIKTYFGCFKRALEYIQTKEGIKLEFEEYDDVKYLPKLPEADINEFHKWNLNRDQTKKLVFYYNYLPRSGQRIPIFHHDNFIIQMAESHPNYIFILPTFSRRLRNYVRQKSMHSFVNLIECEKQFNCRQTVICENLFKIQKIVELCDYSIHFDIGACFFYLNNRTKTSKNIPIHLSVKEYYFNNLMENSEEIKKKTIFILADNQDIAYSKIKDILV
jgi:hypothetical protein